MTKTELRKKLKAEGFRDDSYYLDGETPPYDGLVLTETYGKWKVEYVERGMRRTFGEFASENEACEEFYKTLQEDGAAKI